jgi:hypothetical protein
MSTGSPGNVTCQSLTTNVFSNQSYIVFKGKYTFTNGGGYYTSGKICTIPQDGLYQVTVRQILNPNPSFGGFWGICNSGGGWGNFIPPVGGDVWLDNNSDIATHFGNVAGFDPNTVLEYQYTLANSGLHPYTSANLLFQFTNGQNLYFYAGIYINDDYEPVLYYSITVRYLSSS